MELAPHLSLFVREGPLDAVVTWGDPIRFDGDRKRHGARGGRCQGGRQGIRLSRPPMPQGPSSSRRPILIAAQTGAKSHPHRRLPKQARARKKAFVKSYGCQMNVYDAQRMADVLATEGYAGTATIEEADLVILNTCHIREKAAEKVYSELGASARSRPRRLVRDEGGRGGLRRPGGGCGDPSPSPSVDVVVGPQSYHRLPELLSKATTGRVVDTEFPVEDKFDHLPAPSAPAIRSRGVSAFLTIQEGCDKFCTFCGCPTPGAPRCRARSPGSSRRRDALRRPASSFPSSART